MSASELQGPEIMSTEAAVPAENGKPSVVLTNGTIEKNPGKSQNGQKDSRSTVGATTGERLSGAELKKRAKAEKAAKRAQEKQAKPEEVLPDLRAPKKVETLGDIGRRGSAGTGAGPLTTPSTKVHHKRTGSIQKSLPVRPLQPQAVASTLPPKKENKNVALFAHLYGQPRRTTIAAAGKDVHPTVLALGLQMSNYVICGSNARCVATLLAFKRVQCSIYFELQVDS